MLILARAYPMDVHGVVLPLPIVYGMLVDVCCRLVNFSAVQSMPASRFERNANPT